jgi:hypothetical protein
MLQDKAPRNGTLNRGTTPKDVVTIATDQNAGDDFRPACLAYCTLKDL